MTKRMHAAENHLQDITLNKVPIPDKNIACQDLLAQGVSHKGWLKRKKPWKIAGALAFLLKSLSWDQKFVVISKGCMYFYGNDTENKPDKAISLFGYTRVMRAGELCTGLTLWPFKVAYVLDDKDRVHYFSATCEDDQMEWMKKIKKELYKANGVEYLEEDDDEESLNDLETPISTGNYFKKINNLNRIKEDMEDDSDLDTEYDYIDGDLRTKVPFPFPETYPNPGSSSPRGITPLSPPSSRQLPLPPTKPEKPPSPPPKPGKTKIQSENDEDGVSNGNSRDKAPSPGHNTEQPSTSASKQVTGPKLPPKQAVQLPTMNFSSSGRMAPPTPAKPPRGREPAMTENSSGHFDRDVTPPRPNFSEKKPWQYPIPDFTAGLLSRQKCSAPIVPDQPRTPLTPIPLPPLSPRQSNGPTAVVLPVRSFRSVGTKWINLYI